MMDILKLDQLPNKIHSPIFQEWLSNFISPNTQTVYFLSIKKFFSYIHQQNLNSLLSISPVVAIQYRDHLIAQGFSNHSINRELSTLSSLFRFLIGRHLIATNPFQNVKKLPTTSKKVSVFPTPDEVNLLLGSFVGTHALFFKLLSLTGQRIGSILNLKKSDFNNIGDLLIFSITVKGNKSKNLPVPRILRTDIEAHLLILGDNDFLFSTDSKKPWIKSNVNTILKRRCKKLGLREISPHGFRRHRLTKLLSEHEAYLVAEQVSFHSDLTTLVRHYLDKDSLDLSKNPIL